MGMERLLRGIILACIFALPAVPFLISGSMFFPFITGKNFAFRIIVEIAFAAWVALAVFRPAYRPVFSWLLVLLAGFVFSIGISDALGPNPFKSFWSNFERMEGYITLLHLLALAVVSMGVMKSQYLWQRFLVVTVVLSACMGLAGLNDFYAYMVNGAGAARIDGRFGNPIYLAIYAAFHVFFSVLLLMWLRAVGWVRILLIGNIVLQIVVLYLTATRGTMLGLLGGTVVAAGLVALFHKENKMLRRVSLGVIASVVLLVSGFIAIKDNAWVQETPVLARFAAISFDSGTVASRLMIWRMAMNGVAERPVFGWGQENYSFVFDKYYNPNMYAQEPWFDRVHNIVFDWLIQGGIVGALLYFSIPFAVLYYLWLYRREDSPFTSTERAVITGLLVTYFFHNLFVFDNITSYFFYILLLAFVHTRAVGEDAEALLPEKSVSEATARTVVLPAAIVFGMFLMYIANGAGIANATALIQGITGHPEGPQTNYRAFEGAVTRGGLGRQEAAEQTAQTAATIVRSTEITDQVIKQNFTALAEKAIQREIAATPDLARLHMFYATFLGQSGRYSEALEAIQKAEAASPRKQLIKFQKAEILLNLQRFTDAKAVVEEAYQLAPDYGDAVILLAFTSLYAGDHARAKEVLLEKFGTEAVDDERLVRAYAAQKVYTPLIEIFKARIAANPKDGQSRVSLAAIYLEDKKPEMALTTVEEAIAAVPETATQLTPCIAGIKAGKPTLDLACAPAQ